MKSEPMLTPRGKCPLSEYQRRFELATLHHADTANTAHNRLSCSAPPPPPPAPSPRTTAQEDSGTYKVTACLTMEVKAVTHTVHWPASQSDTKITHAIILPDSMNLLHNVESGLCYPDWHVAMHSLRLHSDYCEAAAPAGHAGVLGNEQLNRLA